MFVLDWSAYPFIVLSVALPMTVFYVLERRREVREDEAAGPMPCMAHTGTDRDGTELWCWQKYGHSGAHDDYTPTDASRVAEGFRRLLGCPEPTCLFDVDHEGPHMCWEGMDQGVRCVLAKGHEGDHNPFADHDDWGDDPECPAGVHSMFDPCPGGCSKPLPDLPQRLSHVPTQDASRTCLRSSNCQLEDAHGGPCDLGY
jgi:hypothetical protein